MLLYDETPAPRRQTDLPERRRPVDVLASGLSLHTVLSILARRAPWIAGCVILCAAMALISGKAMTPRYTAEAQIYIDPRDLRLVEKELTPAGQDSTGYLTIVESQAQVVTSSNVLGRVVRDLKLDRDPEFVGQPGGGWLATLGLSQGDAATSEAPEGVALDALAKRVAVRRTGRTFIVGIEVWTREADKAARIANAVVASYLAEEAATRADSANRASSGLSARLEELRDALNRAESRVQLYKAENGLVGTRDVLVTDQQLTQINSQLAAARVRAADALARFEQIQRAQKAGLDAGATTDTLASGAIATMRGQYAELNRKQAELLNDLGPRHPLVASINSQMLQARRLIDQEVARYLQAARNELSRAQATVTALERDFDQAKGRTNGLAQASIRLRELEREAEASRAVYEAFLVRARETGQQARLDVGNARIITHAIRPLQRSYPAPARTLAGLGAVIGLILGLVLAFGEERLKRDGSGRRSPRPDTERDPADTLPTAALAGAR